MGMEGLDGQPGRPVMDFADLQKLSAQLTGYYTGLTQGMMREEHTAVLRCFLEGVREVRPLACLQNAQSNLCSCCSSVLPERLSCSAMTSP